MNYIGILQTGDVGEAISKAEELVHQGRHVLCHRVSFEMTPEAERAFMEQDPDGYVHAMREHDSIEYEVYVDRDG